jgi:hypothetical protein
VKGVLNPFTIFVVVYPNAIISSTVSCKSGKNFD